jgi:hypothetical protein
MEDTMSEDNPEHCRRLDALLPMKGMMRTAIAAAAKVVPEREPDRYNDMFLMWLGEKMADLIEIEIDTHSGVDPLTRNLRKIILSIIQTDPPYRKTALRFVGLIRSGKVPYSDNDKLWLKECGIKVE